MDRINFDLLRTFLEVGRLEHLGKAAESLQTDQSTVSRKIARLEQEVGVPLFERIGRNIRLTQSGKGFLGRADRIAQDMRQAVADAATTMSADTGEVHVGFLHTVGARWLPERLVRFRDSSPRVRFILREATSSEIVAGVLSGTFDLGILGPPPQHVDLEVTPLFREQVSVVVPAGHRLAHLPYCALIDLAEEPLILPRSRSGLRRIIDDEFARHGINQHVAYEGDDFTIVQGLVEAGLGTTLLPTPVPVPSNRVAVVPLRDPPIARTMAVACNRRRVLPPAAARFVRSLTDNLSEPA